MADDARLASQRQLLDEGGGKNEGADRVPRVEVGFDLLVADT